MKATKKSLIGRTIVDVDFQPFQGGDGIARSKFIAYKPVLTLDNGRTVWFETQETEAFKYGTAICISDQPKGKKA